MLLPHRGRQRAQPLEQDHAKRHHAVRELQTNVDGKQAAD
jgi:hypothetical protein